jgi:mono/diheme cytochrome c family protein
MKALKTVVVIVIALTAAALAVAKHHTPEERGKALFSDPKLGGGTAGKSCNSCHTDGKGLAGVADRKDWKTPGGPKNIEEMVNTCITMALKGKPLDVKSGQMQDLVSYLRTFKP